MLPCERWFPRAPLASPYGKRSSDWKEICDQRQERIQDSEVSPELAVTTKHTQLQVSSCTFLYLNLHKTAQPSSCI